MDFLHSPIWGLTGKLSLRQKQDAKEAKEARFAVAGETDTGPKKHVLEGHADRSDLLGWANEVTSRGRKESREAIEMMSRSVSPLRKRVHGDYDAVHKKENLEARERYDLLFEEKMEISRLKREAAKKAKREEEERWTPRDVTKRASEIAAPGKQTGGEAPTKEGTDTLDHDAEKGSLASTTERGDALEVPHQGMSHAQMGAMIKDIKSSHNLADLAHEAEKGQDPLEAQTESNKAKTSTNNVNTKDDSGTLPPVKQGAGAEMHTGSKVISARPLPTPPLRTDTREDIGAQGRPNVEQQARDEMHAGIAAIKSNNPRTPISPADADEKTKHTIRAINEMQDISDGADIRNTTASHPVVAARLVRGESAEIVDGVVQPAGGGKEKAVKMVKEEAKLRQQIRAGDKGGGADDQTKENLPLQEKKEGKKMTQKWAKGTEGAAARSDGDVSPKSKTGSAVASLDGAVDTSHISSLDALPPTSTTNSTTKSDAKSETKSASKWARGTEGEAARAANDVSPKSGTVSKPIQISSSQTGQDDLGKASPGGDKWVKGVEGEMARGVDDVSPKSRAMDKSVDTPVPNTPVPAMSDGGQKKWGMGKEGSAAREEGGVSPKSGGVGSLGSGKGAEESDGYFGEGQTGEESEEEKAAARRTERWVTGEVGGSGEGMGERKMSVPESIESLRREMRQMRQEE